MGSRVQGSGLRVRGSGFSVQCSGLRALGFGGSEFMCMGSGFRVPVRLCYELYNGGLYRNTKKFRFG